MNKVIVGTKYFKLDSNGGLEILRVVNNKGEHIKLKTEDGTNIKLSEKALKRDYTRLNASALISFNIVTIQKLSDVIVMVYRREETLSENDMPYCVCRQNITDFFANSILKDKDPNSYICGMSVTKDTVPEGVTLQSILACDGVEKSDIIATYKTDTLNTILGLVKTKDYDNVLHNLFTDHLMGLSRKYGRMFYTINQDKDMMDGYCKTLKGLLQSNNFMYDYLRGFDIYPLDIDLSKDNEKSLSEDNKEVIQFLLRENIDTSMVVNYGEDIDLEKIQSKYVLISDKYERLYVVAYTSSDQYHIPIEQVEGEKNLENISKSINYNPNSSATQALYRIRLNKSKYE